MTGNQQVNHDDRTDVMLGIDELKTDIHTKQVVGEHVEESYNPEDDVFTHLEAFAFEDSDGAVPELSFRISVVNANTDTYAIQVYHGGDKAYHYGSDEDCMNVVEKIREQGFTEADKVSTASWTHFYDILNQGESENQ
jgi:hypothetical protein